ncbi:MAG: hypothetical protein ACOY5F_13050 [Pseudomonadota bacterium]
MLPDLRIVIAAVFSTFVLSAGVGFYASSRLIGETKKGTDSISAFEETPVNRIALSWPEPVRQPEPLALDFAVTAKALRNPVRDITGEPAEAAAAPHPVRSTATELTAPRATPSEIAPAQTVAAASAPVDKTALPAMTEAPKPAPEPEIRVAVQYPPVQDLPPELQAPVAPPLAVAPPAVDAPTTTGSIADEPKTDEPKTDEPKTAGPDLRELPPAASEPELRIAGRPEPADAVSDDRPAIADVPLPKPAPKLAAKKAAQKKAKKAARRPFRRATPAVTDPVPNFFSFFNLQQPR